MSIANDRRQRARILQGGIRVKRKDGAIRVTAACKPYQIDIDLMMEDGSPSGEKISAADLMTAVGVPPVPQWTEI